MIRTLIVDDEPFARERLVIDDEGADHCLISN